MPGYGIFVGPMTSVSRADRLELLASILRDRPGITSAALAEALGVSVRSVMRDLELLRDRGYPVEAARGRGGGIRLRGSWGLGRVHLTREEALCTLLGLAASEALGLPLFAAELSRARRRIADAFPREERRRIAPLRERILIGQAASAAVRATWGDPRAAAMRVIQAAFVAERVVDLEYAREDGARSARRMEPHALLINLPAWYLVGTDHFRGAVRTFRLDRVLSAVETGEGFRPDPATMLRELRQAGVRFDQV